MTRRGLHRLFKVNIVLVTTFICIVMLREQIIDAIVGRSSPALVAKRRWTRVVAAQASPQQAFINSLSTTLFRANRVEQLAMSTKVFQSDPRLGYRFRPNFASTWYHVKPFNYILGPDDTETRKLAKEAGGGVVAGSEQHTNSWGWRGPEPDPSARYRVLIVGDSVIQGMLVGDSQTPPARLAAHLGQEVSVVGAGAMGYSPEQYWGCVETISAKFPPHAIIVAVCSNDVGADDAEEQARWLSLICDECRRRDIPCVVAALPAAPDAPNFPDGLRRGLRPPAIWLDLGPAIRSAVPPGTRWQDNPNYNGHLPDPDSHLSPRGCDLWAREVAKALGKFSKQSADGPTLEGSASSPGVAKSKDLIQ